MRVCSGAGCLRAVPDDARYCAECRAERSDAAKTDGIKNHSTAYDAVLDGLRKGTRWQRVRALIVNRCPLCARCELSATAIIDHIVPAAIAIAQAQDSGHYPLDKYAGYYLVSNLQGLCRSCHGTKTLEDKAHVGPWPDVLAREAAAPRKVWSF
jgi:5-methylcytosine-specific restriction endonuclease McrA